MRHHHVVTFSQTQNRRQGVHICRLGIKKMEGGQELQHPDQSRPVWATRQSVQKRISQADTFIVQGRETRAKDEKNLKLIESADLSG